MTSKVAEVLQLHLGVPLVKRNFCKGFFFSICLVPGTEDQPVKEMITSDAT